MRTYVYHALLEPGENEGVVVATFPDVPEAITQGDGVADALAQAREALETALLTYPMEGLSLPESSTVTDHPIVVSAEAAAKLAVLEAFAAAGISKSEFARRIGRAETEARRILDPMHATKLPMLEQALAVLGRRLVVGVEDIAPAA